MRIAEHAKMWFFNRIHYEIHPVDISICFHVRKCPPIQINPFDSSPSTIHYTHNTHPYRPFNIDDLIHSKYVHTRATTRLTFSFVSSWRFPNLFKIARIELKKSVGAHQSKNSLKIQHLSFANIEPYDICKWWMLNFQRVCRHPSHHSFF